MKKHLSILVKPAFLSAFLATVAMLSATASGGIYLVDVTDMYNVTASGPTPAAHQPPDNAFNNRLGGNNKWFVTAAFTPPAMEIKFDTGAQLIQAYTLTTGADADTRQPKEWVLSGWDGSDWVELDHRTDVAQRGANTKATYYILDNKKAYQEYKIDFLATNGATDFQVGEIELCRILQGQDVTETFMPAITSNNAVAGAHVFTRLFDNNTDGNHKAGSSPVPTPDAPWTMTFTFPDGVSPNIIGYRVASANDVDGRDPALWSLHAGTDTNGAVIAPLEHRTAFFGRQSWLAFEATPGRQNSLTWNIGEVYNADGASGMSQIGELEILEKVHIDRTNTNYMDVIASVKVSSQNNNRGTFALDNSLSTKWYTEASTAPADVTSAWLSVELANNPVISRYSISAVNEGGVGSEPRSRNPMDWTLQARESGSTPWVDLHSVAGADFASARTQYFDFENSTGYSEYRLVVTSALAGTQAKVNTQINNFNLYEVTDLYQVSHLPGMVNIYSPQGPATGAQAPLALLDGDTVSKWYNTANPTADAPLEVIFEFQQPFAVQEYSLTTGGDVEGRDPADWILYGSSDGNIWEMLDEVDSMAFSNARQETYSFLLDNDMEYDFYKFEFLATKTAGNGLQLAEIGLWAPLGQSGSGVPEPATWAMLLSGMAGLMFIRRKAVFTH